MNEEMKDCARLPVVAWQVEFPLGNGAKVYEQRPSWAYESYGDVTYVTHELCRLTDAQALLAEKDARIAEQQGAAIELARLLNEACEEIRELKAKLQAAPAERGVVLPERRQLPDLMMASYHEAVGRNQALDEVARLNPAPATAEQPVVDERAIDRLARFIETVRECERLASDYSGTIDGVEEHGGDDHEDPICAVFHRLYYAMFDGDAVLAELRASIAPATADSDVREVKK